MTNQLHKRFSTEEVKIFLKKYLSENVNSHSTVNGKYLAFCKKSPLMNKGFPAFHPSQIAQMAW